MTCAWGGGAAAAAGVPLGATDGGIEWFKHVFPVRGPHGERGPIGEFGAPRSGGRVHEGFDILAACGTELVSVVTGKVREVGYDPILYGNYLLIHGQGEHRTYMYAHMQKAPVVHKGERVWAGERVGEVGKTGNARTVGCQLHIEIHVNGVPIDPKPEVERWDRGS
ncbi:MAG TPA: M23 family metallopeptidase [Solirubrobacterales bacterium]|nr:M23 family metallopeptidase [Solirubrobacterales bacterium]